MTMRLEQMHDYLISELRSLEYHEQADALEELGPKETKLLLAVKGKNLKIAIERLSKITARKHEIGILCVPELVRDTYALRN